MKMEINEIIQLINTVSSSKLTRFRYEEDDVKIVLEKNTQGQVIAAQALPLQIQTAAEQTAAEEESGETTGNVIKSPLVGTFYNASSPESDAFVSVGDTVKKGQTLGIIEAMKLMNEIECEFDGVVAEILVENEEMVEYGQPLFVIR